ncbi:MAG TPA: C40 family peptidase [Gemmatimonadales bacterium]|nr:C40 family peptidase [Gemmatimonadales bacterium]
MRLKLLAILLLLSGSHLEPAQAQVLEARVGRFYDSPGWTAYRVGFTRHLGGIFAVQVHGDYLERVTDVGGFAGIGSDLTAFRTGNEGPYLVAGLSGGLGSDSTKTLSALWGSWSAGLGYDVFPASFLSVGAEGRWRELSLGHKRGLEIAVGVGIHVGRRSGPSERRPPPTSAGGPILVPATASSSELPAPAAEWSGPAGLANSIIATATDAMGRPYEFGGTGGHGEGFDCSGLIQYAYGKHGIRLPRRSVDQAGEGTKVERNPKVLKPADLLTFSNRGGQVTHVGLYIGNGRFIHSATRGVQVSTLSASDPYGRWWYKRWVGVRRIVR